VTERPDASAAPARARRWSLLSPPDGLVAWLRWLALLFGLMNLSVVLAVMCITSTGPRETVLAVATVVTLTAYLFWGYAGRRYSAPADVLAACALFFVGVQLVTPVRALAVFIAIVGFRSLYGHDRRIAPVGALNAASFVAAMLAPAVTRSTPAVVEAVLPGLLMMLGASLVHLVIVTLVQHERDAVHSIAMADTAAALLAAGDPTRIMQTALDASRSLLKSPVGTGMFGALVRGEELVVVANDGTKSAPAITGRLSMKAVPESLRDGLGSSRPFICFGLEVRDGHLSRQVTMAGAAMLVVPLASRGHARGALFVPHADGVHRDGVCDCEAALEVVASHAALALDSAILTEDVIRSETRFRSLVQNCSDVISVVDVKGMIRYLSPTVARVLGYAPAHIVGARFDNLIHPDDFPEWMDFFRQLVQGTTRTSISCRLRHRDGSFRHTEIVGANCLNEPSVAGIVLDVRDVSERKVLEDELVHRATHDPLTGLPNRREFLEQVREAVASGTDPEGLALLFVDLDGFKTINDNHSHAVGDSILQSVAAQLLQVLRPDDLAARLSGDEFAVLVRNLSRLDEAEHVAMRVLDAIQSVTKPPTDEKDKGAPVLASIGVAIRGADGVEDAEDLIHKADLAMYDAKNKGGSRVQVFRPGVREGLGGRRQLQADLVNAALHGEFEVRYQPVVRLSDGQLTSAEALVRWQHPKKGLLGPNAFIQLAEENNLIADVFEFVLRDACTNAMQWQGHGAPVSVNVNLSAVQLYQAELFDQVTRILTETSLPSELLTLEITESVLVDDIEDVCETLGALKQLGIKIAIDDFGTGYSSLQYLSRLPIDVLKVDKIFVKNVDHDNGAALIRTILDLGMRLGLPTVAEGVETPEQRDALRDLGCSHAQGYLFSRPVSGDRLAALVTGETLPV